MKPKEEVVAAPWASLASRVEAWRRTRTRRTGAMPEELWREAAALAARHGVYRISQALRLNFENLKKRASAEGGLTKRHLAPQRRAQTRADFIEVMGIGACRPREMASDTPRTEIEISTDGGTARFSRIRSAGRCSCFGIGGGRR